MEGAQKKKISDIKNTDEDILWRDVAKPYKSGILKSDFVSSGK